MQKFVFRSNQDIGKAGAEQDGYYLSKCFVDTGTLGILRDCNNAQCILIGRTGSGKSALLTQLSSSEENVLSIRPEALSLAHISNSSVLNFFDEAGVDFDLFFRWLWKHVFCVAILRAKFDDQKETFLSSILELLPGRTAKQRRSREVTRQYLEQWGEEDIFWKETETIVKEVTKTVEDDLRGSVEGKVTGILSLTGATGRKLTEEQKEEVKTRATDVLVNKNQMRQLSDVMDVLSDLLGANRQQRYYITIDKLDEDWAEDRIRLRLIKALLYTALDFATVTNAKVIVALRSDLLERVFRLTRGPGFQEEKFSSNYLDLRWTNEQLTQVLDSRINLLVRNQYTSEIVTHKAVLPPTMSISKRKTQPTVSYMLDRTLCRPRDIIQFFNTCITKADGKTTISAQALRDAEGVYSRGRFDALVDEWFGIHPNLRQFAQLLKNKPETFKVSDLTLDMIEAICLDMATCDDEFEGLDFPSIRQVAEGNLNANAFRRHIVAFLYKVGLVGLKIEAGMPVSWSFLGGVSVSEAEIHDDTSLTVQKTFWRHLGISNRAEVREVV